MAAAFDRITIDGNTLLKGEVLRHFQRLDADPLTHAWAAPLHALVHALITEPDARLTAHTSGTTGAPKPITIPRADLIASSRLTAQAFRLHRGDRALLCLPGEFIAGKMMLVRAMVIGLDLHAIDPRGSILDHLNTTDRFRFAAMVPLQLHRAIQEDQARVEEQFEQILLGGGPTSDALIEDLQPLRTRVWQSYGSTETVTHVALRALNGPAREPHFTAIGDVTFEQDERGCLVVHTPHLTVKKHITNDLVERLDDQRFIWLGRVDNVILSGGKKIFPEQLEARTAGVIPYAHYFTSYADDRLGQAVMLVLETEGPSDEVLPDVLKKVTEVLETHELPRRVTAVRTFKRTHGGKVQRELTLKGIR